MVETTDACGCDITDPNGYACCVEFPNAEHIAHINPFRYRSYYYDTETELYYLQSRYYDPQTGKFLNADDVGYLDPEDLSAINLFAYCGNNPVMYADPSGYILISTLLIGAFIGAAASFLGSVLSQSLTGDKKINWTQVILDTAIGGISGALGASGITKAISIIAGAVLGAAGSVGGDLILSNGDWREVNIGKAILMGSIGALLGSWTGAGTQNAKTMVNTINAGKSWGSKAFLTSAKEVALRPNSGLTIQTMYMNMAKAISKYTVQGISKVSVASFISTFGGNSIGW